MDLTEQIGAEAYVAGNVGSGTVQEMAEWVEYMTAPAGSLAQERARNGRKEPWKVSFFGVGNELWGCGGNMRPEYAADLTRRYATFIKAPAGTRIVKIAAAGRKHSSEMRQVRSTRSHSITIPFRAGGPRELQRHSSMRAAGRRRWLARFAWMS
jgi:alpha-N-arabinofuranosidase